MCRNRNSRFDVGKMECASKILEILFVECFMLTCAERNKLKRFQIQTKHCIKKKNT